MAQMCSRVQSPPPSPTNTHSTNTPRVTIDHLAFPHLVDLVFDFAIPTALVRMSEVCKYWRWKVHCRYYHIFNPSGNDDYVKFSLTPDGEQETLRRPEYRLLLACRVIDLTSGSCFLDHSWITVMNDTIRFKSAIAFCMCPTQTVMPVKRLVCNSFWPNFRPDKWRNVTSFVVTYGRGFQTPSEPSILRTLPTTLPRLTAIVFICREKAPDDELQGQHGFWRELNNALMTWRINTPSRCPQVYVVSSGDEPASEQTALPLLTYPAIAWTFEQHKEHMGEAQYEIESNFDRVLTPPWSF